MEALRFSAYSLKDESSFMLSGTAVLGGVKLGERGGQILRQAGGRLAHYCGQEDMPDVHLSYCPEQRCARLVIGSTYRSTSEPPPLKIELVSWLNPSEATVGRCGERRYQCHTALVDPVGSGRLSELSAGAGPTNRGRGADLGAAAGRKPHAPGARRDAAARCACPTDVY